MFSFFPPLPSPSPPSPSLLLSLILLPSMPLSLSSLSLSPVYLSPLSFRLPHSPSLYPPSPLSAPFYFSLLSFCPPVFLPYVLLPLPFPLPALFYLFPPPPPPPPPLYCRVFKAVGTKVVGTPTPARVTQRGERDRGSR